jgi:hypothetical protein
VLSAECNDWQILNTSAVAPALYSMPFFPSTKNISVRGTVDVYSYLSGNCTKGVNSGLFPFLRFVESKKTSGGKWNKQAYGKLDKIVFGYGFSGKHSDVGSYCLSSRCRALSHMAPQMHAGNCSAPRNLYRNNATLEDNRFNLLWWSGAEGIIGEGMNMTDTIYPGYLWGSAPNSWFPRVNSTNRTNLQSIVLIVEGGEKNISLVHRLEAGAQHHKLIMLDFVSLQLLPSAAQ